MVNKWSEGSDLEYDTMNGLKYVEAERGVFGARKQPVSLPSKVIGMSMRPPVKVNAGP